MLYASISFFFCRLTCNLLYAKYLLNCRGHFLVDLLQSIRVCSGPSLVSFIKTYKFCLCLNTVLTILRGVVGAECVFSILILSTCQNDAVISECLIKSNAIHMPLFLFSFFYVYLFIFLLNAELFLIMTRLKIVAFQVKG